MVLHLTNVLLDLLVGGFGLYRAQTATVCGICCIYIYNLTNRNVPVEIFSWSVNVKTKCCACGSYLYYINPLHNIPNFCSYFFCIVLLRYTLEGRLFLYFLFYYFVWSKCFGGMCSWLQFVVLSSQQMTRCLSTDNRRHLKEKASCQSVSASMWLRLRGKNPCKCCRPRASASNTLVVEIHSGSFCQWTPSLRIHHWSLSWGSEHCWTLSLARFQYRKYHGFV